MPQKSKGLPPGHTDTGAGPPDWLSSALSPAVSQGPQTPDSQTPHPCAGQSTLLLGGDCRLEDSWSITRKPRLGWASLDATFPEGLLVRGSGLPVYRGDKTNQHTSTRVERHMDTHEHEKVPHPCHSKACRTGLREHAQGACPQCRTCSPCPPHPHCPHATHRHAYAHPCKCACSFWHA